MNVFLKRLIAKIKIQSDEAVPNPMGTEFETNNRVLSEFVIRRLVPSVGFHPYPLNELMLMAGTLCRFRPSHVFEWGTNIGASARVFYETASNFQIPLEVHSVDLPPSVEHAEQPGKRRGRLVKNRPGVFLHLGDGLETSLSIYRSRCADQRALFFIDGDHSYDSVKKELETILKNVDDPLVLLHDTFYQSEDSGYNVGPHRAIQDVLKNPANGRARRTLSLNTGLPGMTLVY